MTSRRQFLASALAAPLAAATRPNIVLIMADDLGASDLSCYGCPDIRTPHIDSLARAGVRFTQFYANAPECSPTRTGLLTGRYQQRVGGLECAIGVGNVGRYDEAEWLASRGELGLPPEETSVAQMLKGAGYDTAILGKWHLGYGDKFTPNRHGFDEFFGILGGNADYFTHLEDNGENVLSHNGKLVRETGYVTDLLGRRSVDWLKARTASKPYFLYLPFTAPHTPLQGPGDGPVADKTKWNAGTRETYIKMVERMDEQVGAVLKAVEQTGQASNTIVIFKSDNGGYAKSRNYPFRAGKSTVFEGGIRVPAIVRWPDRLKHATTSQVAISMDLTATILSAAGVKPARALDGMDLLPVLEGKAAPSKRTLFWSYKRGKTRRWAVRDGDDKYLIDDGKEYVHNLKWDERETTNLIADEPLAKRLRGLVADWKKETAAPRLRNFRPA